MGVSTLYYVSFSEILLRWVNLMLDRALHKLNKVNDILEQEVRVKEFIKQQKRDTGQDIKLSGEGGVDVDQESSGSDSNNE